MKQIKTCLNCLKPNEPPFNLFGDACECTNAELKAFSDKQYSELSRMHGYSEPSINECISILELNGYRVNKVNKNKQKRLRKNRGK